jgi:hypothetical protein
MTDSTNQPNVVSLNTERDTKAAHEREPQAVLARMPAAMHRLREKAQQTLQGLLRGLFDKADDALFELADQAANNHEQNLYFDSMRQVRLSRKDVEAEFLQRLDIGFARIMDATAFPDVSDEAATTDADGLSLVGNDELEELVASETMINRANEQFAEQMQHLTLRIGQLVPVKVYQKNNPVGSDAICTAFIEASGDIDIDVKARLVLLKLFDRLVMCALGDLYDQLNQQLIEANILPSLRGDTAARKAGANTRKARSERASQARDEASSDDGAEQLLGTLRGLLKAQGGGDSGAPSGPSLPSKELLSLLTLAQQRTQVEPEQQLSAVSAEDIKAQVGYLLTRGGAGQHRITEVDEDVINLVSMMFEFILEDRSLADPMKALLARLQIPMIKAAIADKTFFGKGGHPARRLLNEMATAAIGWQDTGVENRGKDLLYRHIEQTVNTVLSDFAKDVDVFSKLLLEFRAFQEKEKRRAKILEQRTIDAEDGKARSQRARTEVDAALEEITAGVELPRAAAELLASAWSNVLFITCLKQGPESEQFVEQLQTARELVWSATASMTGDNRQKLLKLVPGLLAKLRGGLEDIAFNPYQMGQMFKALEKLHLEVLRRNPQQPPKTQQPEAAAPAQPSAPEAAATEPEQPLAEAPPMSAPSVEPPEAGAKAPQDLVAAEAAHDDLTIAERETEEGIDAQHLALVANLTQGSWFEMSSAAGETYRCRLAAIIKPTGKYIFVNRTGMKVAEEDKPSLAVALKEGRIRLLDDGMLFDRALESVIGNLRQSRGSRRG